MRLLAAILFASAALSHAAENAAGRWEGSVQIPGVDLRLIVDLAGDRKFNEPMFFTSS